LELFVEFRRTVQDGPFDVIEEAGEQLVWRSVEYDEASDGGREARKALQLFEPRHLPTAARANEEG
jgi:hypothetical protein